MKRDFGLWYATEVPPASHHFRLKGLNGHPVEPVQAINAIAMNPGHTVGASQPPSLRAGFGIAPIHPWRDMARLMQIKELPQHTGTLDIDTLTHRTTEWR
jgi:hypothetical protein